MQAVVGVFTYIPTSVFNKKFANFSSLVKTLIMELITEDRMS